MQKANLRETKFFYKFCDTPQNVTAIFTNRRLNAGFLNQTEENVKNNREIILSKLGLELPQLVCAKQAHSANVYIAEAQDKGRGSFIYDEAIINMDAFITKEKGIALSIFVADCLPVFVIDKRSGAIGLIHAGWKGTKNSIVKKAIIMMQQSFESRPKDLTVLFGPSIRKCCCEVGQEFLKYFKRGVDIRDDNLYLDLVGINYLQLKEIGVPDNNIFDSGICTFCQNDRFFSYRKEKDSCGRQMALITAM